MPATITLSDIAWATPDGRALFPNLDLSFDGVRTGLVGRNGVGKTTLLKLISGDLLPRAGKVTVSGTLGVLRQSVRVAPGQTVSHLLGTREALSVLRRAEAGEAGIDELAAADWTLETRIAAALAAVDLDVSPETPLDALSGGQRTRAALAALVLKRPDFILLDEPTNNLDRDGRNAVIELLRNWRNGAVVVSHDRELLDTMDAIVELTSLGATRYGGNWSRYRERKTTELAAARDDLVHAEQRVEEIERRAQTTAERKARRDAAGRRKRAKGDMPRILLNGLKNRSENTAGGNARLAEDRREKALDDLASARERIEVLQPFSIVLPSTGLPPGKTVLRLHAIRAGYQPDRPIIRDLSLIITGPERLAVTGPNGSGKTTLLELIAGRISPWSGSVKITTDFAMLDQQVSLLDPRLSIRDNFLRINPGQSENACRATLARFMFRADAALQTVSSLSGGQMLRAGLACVLGGKKPPPLLILDEPTNHLDIDSIETVEAGLRAYDGALLVVSHDETFLDAIEVSRKIEM
ncbi:ABC-F family ATP-binding cassette domain-containing protein [Mesorhizobium sp. 1B3]|uniref:ABC-F family ATP-binding cassette domain-containing protein n=1 Tax=Mesorhizobium sp. 1B3 TaxID=3243599 RepID=UPI003D9514EE